MATYEKYTDARTMSLKSLLSSDTQKLYMTGNQGTNKPGNDVLDIENMAGGTTPDQWWTAYWLLDDDKGVPFHLLINAKTGGCITFSSKGDQGFVHTLPYVASDPSKQLWAIRNDTNGLSFVSKVDPDAVLDVRLADKSSGTKVIAFHEHYGANQLWTAKTIVDTA